MLVKNKNTFYTTTTTKEVTGPGKTQTSGQTTTQTFQENHISKSSVQGGSGNVTTFEGKGYTF